MPFINRLGGWLETVYQRDAEPEIQQNRNQKSTAGCCLPDGRPQTTTRKLAGMVISEGGEDKKHYNFLKLKDKSK